MEVPRADHRFAVPNPRPSSPPTTPGSRSRNTSITSYTSFSQNKRHDAMHLGLSPPENIEPRGLGHQFSYTPPDRDEEESDDSSSSSSTSEDDTDDESDENDPIPEIETKSDIAERRASRTRQLDDDTEFVVEEISDDDIGYENW